MKKNEIKANIKLLEDEGFNISTCEDGSFELESYTDAGGDMLIYVDELSRANLLRYIYDFDINNEVVIWWQNGADGKKTPFADIRQHYNDVENWCDWCEQVFEQLKY